MDGGARPGIALPAGRAWCFQCGSFSCEHALAPGPRLVLAGYGATGLPEWQEFSALVLAERPEAVDGLFAEPPGRAAVFRAGRRVQEKILRPYRPPGSPSVLAELAAGYFAESPGREGIFAITVQVLRSGSPPAVSAGLTVIGRTPSGRSALELFAEQPHERLQRSLAAARGSAAAIAAAASAQHDAARAAQIWRRIPALLQSLAREIERAGRQAERRTRHAFERRQARRPTATALSDAARAPREAFFLDERRDTLIVAGPRGRVHAFTREGRHVTTLWLDRPARERRLRDGRWRPALPEEIAAFRACLAAPGGDSAGSN